MSFTPVQHSAGATGTGLTASQSFPGATTAGSFLVAILAVDGGIAPTTPSGWTLAKTLGLTVAPYIYYRANAPSISSLSVTLNSSDDWILFLAEYSTSVPLILVDQTGSDFSGTSGSVTTTSAVELVVAALTKNTNQTYGTPTGGFAIEGQASVTGAASLVWLDQIVSSTGTYSTSVTGTPEGGVIASFVASGASTFSASGSASASFSGSSEAASSLSAPGVASASFAGFGGAAASLSATGVASASFVGGSLAASMLAAPIPTPPDPTASLSSALFSGGSLAGSTFTVSGEGASIVAGAGGLTGSPPLPVVAMHGSASAAFSGASLAGGVFSAGGDSSFSADSESGGGGLFMWMPPNCAGCCGSTPSTPFCAGCTIALPQTVTLTASVPGSWVVSDTFNFLPTWPYTFGPVAFGAPAPGWYSMTVHTIFSNTPCGGLPGPNTNLRYYQFLNSCNWRLSMIGMTSTDQEFLCCIKCNEGGPCGNSPIPSGCASDVLAWPQLCAAHGVESSINDPPGLFVISW